MSVTYYLFLQDRVEEALARFHAVRRRTRCPTQLQHDYFQLLRRLLRGQPRRGPRHRRAVRRTSGDSLAQALRRGDLAARRDRRQGARSGQDDKPDREKQQAELAATEPAFDFKVENQTIALTWKNLGEVTVNYYLMDPEFSFSSSPFVSQDAGRFSIIKPNKTATQALPAGQGRARHRRCPPSSRRRTCSSKSSAPASARRRRITRTRCKLTVTENYGRLEVRDSRTDKPLPQGLRESLCAAARRHRALLQGRLHRPARPLRLREPEQPRESADSRCRCGGADAPANGLDYQMLKPAELNTVEKLAILVLSDTNGAEVREVGPPSE